MTFDELSEWLLVYVAVMIGQPSETLSLDMTLRDLDMDSVDSVNLALELEKKFEVPVDPELFLNGDKSLNNVLVTFWEQLAKAPKR